MDTKNRTVCPRGLILIRGNMQVYEGRRVGEGN